MTTFPVYHYCITWDGTRAEVLQTNDLRANMRDVYFSDELPYAAHTYQRNAYAAGLSIMGMEGARPDDFGTYPLREECISALCEVAAQLAHAYDIAIDADHVMTHAEAAIIDGYFGTDDDQRWDMGLLEPIAEPLDSRNALAAGDALRARIAAFAAHIAP